MFQEYSDRAKRVIFLTRLKAGRRGAAALEPEHLIEALVIEDQGEMAKEFGESDEHMMSGLKPRRSFFSPETASELILELERTSTNSVAIPDSTDMPMSPALGRTFEAAMALRKELGQEWVEPLHLLAAALAEQSTRASEVLKEAGVTSEAVIAATKSGDYS